MKKWIWINLSLVVMLALLMHACTGQNTAEPAPTTDSTDNPQPVIPTLSAETNPTPVAEDLVGYPRIANLWGLYRLDYPAEYYANFDLLIPYTFKEANRVSGEIYQLNPDALILHSQYSTKGREELDDLIHEWWVSEKGDPGYPCLLRNSAGDIIITKTWKHPMVNLINADCREQMAEKNITEFTESTQNPDGLSIYTGIYWDLLYGRISWLADDIDTDLDGSADIEETLDADYKKGVTDFLISIRQALPSAVLMGNESPIDFASLINGRLYEWQIPSLLDGLQLSSWEQIIEEYRLWSDSGYEPRTTTIQNAPADSLIGKYRTTDVDEMPKAMMEEAAASYQRMRFGLASALMGDGYYSFDFGKMAHGQFWWYDEYGRMIGEDTTSTLPQQGYLGQPLGEPIIIDSTIADHKSQSLQDTLKELITSPEEDTASYDVWGRKFEHGMAIINPTGYARSITLEDEYCRLNGTQAPLFKVMIDDDEAKYIGNWQNMEANYDQIGESVHVAPAEAGSSLTYAPDLLFDGNYEVFAWIVPQTNQAKQVEFTVNHKNGTSTVFVDQTSGEPAWRSLGNFEFKSGNDQSVTIHSSSAGNVVADAVKWVSAARFNDGSQVTSLIIQAYDGIILVDCSLNEGNK